MIDPKSGVSVRIPSLSLKAIDAPERELIP